MPHPFDGLDLRDPGSVAAALLSGADANRTAPCREGSIDRVRAAPGVRLIATGDLHDNPLHLARLIAAAGMDGGGGGEEGRGGAQGRAGAPLAHLTLHEIIHSDRLMNGMDFSYRALTRVAALKAAFPGHVHTLLANHELAQIGGSGIVKDGVRVVDAFNDAVAFSFPDDAGRVGEAAAAFIRSMPLALRLEGRGPGRDILCAHSLPAPELMDRFDPGVIERDLTEEDYAPRRGSAHLMVWGRGQTPTQLAALGERWGIGLFVLGHEKAEAGILAVEPNSIVLNSDHERGVYLVIDPTSPPSPAEAVSLAVPLAHCSS